ncbi:hypothetical protein CDEST_01339 [Colletotrichum destructivum]|uniref:Uncharacterized protein n=1 Tax=Colletotrichum destructivum TaxID=34406 RepID=A0AAX4HZF3_9PEZI|nr:hypothetical protein CDEST_01339 [Colletotrichum destructivum]
MDCLVGGALCLPGKNPPSPDAPANFHSGKITGHRRAVSRRVRNGWREAVARRLGVLSRPS